MTIIEKSGCPKFQESLEKLLKLIERELKGSKPDLEASFISCDLLLGTENFPTWGEKYKCTRYSYLEYINGIYTFIDSNSLATKVRDFFPLWLKESFDVELNHISHQEVSPHPEKYALSFDKNLPEEHQEIIVLVAYEFINFEETPSMIYIALPNLLYDHIYTNTVGGVVTTKVEAPMEDQGSSVMSQDEVNARLNSINSDSNQKTKEIKILKEKIEQLETYLTSEQFKSKSDNDKQEFISRLFSLKEKLESLEDSAPFGDLDF